MLPGAAGRREAGTGADNREARMITLIEALNYRCLRYVSRSLGPFHVLVGPNASGKTTFLDVVDFLRDLVSKGLDAAVSNRTRNPQDLLFLRAGERFELALEAHIPDELRQRTARPELDTARYEVAVGYDETERQFELKAERFFLKEKQEAQLPPRSLFPMPPVTPGSLLRPESAGDRMVVFNEAPHEGLRNNMVLWSETADENQGGWNPWFKLGSKNPALGNLPLDTDSFPVGVWFRELLGNGVQQFVLNILAIRQPSPPIGVTGFSPDGSNLPWAVDRLRQENGARFRDWINHLRTVLADLKDISTVERPEDRHCYMVYEYTGGLKVPSWLVSDGTLRLTALTLPAYMEDLQGIYLIEEPENGIHPGAVAAVHDSLSSVYGGQVLLASHSPVVLNAAGMGDVLCFARDDTGATDIVLGSEHPMLQQWRGDACLGTLHASGVLG